MKKIVLQVVYRFPWPKHPNLDLLYESSSASCDETALGLVYLNELAYIEL